MNIIIALVLIAAAGLLHFYKKENNAKLMLVLAIASTSILVIDYFQNYNTKSLVIILVGLVWIFKLSKSLVKE